MIFGGCYFTGPNGWTNFSYPLDPGAFLGTYALSIAGDFGELGEIIIYSNTSFDVVSMTVTADGDGPYEGMVHQPILFHGMVTGGKPPYTWHWDFGDSNTSTDQSPMYTYNTTGIYPIHLTVTDTGGHTGNDATTAIVYGPDFGYYLIVFTDETTYYPGETVNISGRITDNGSGVPSIPITLHIEDPQETIITINLSTNETGYYLYGYPLDYHAPTGVYNVTTNASIPGRELIDTTSFEVLPHIIVVDAYGPYDRTVDHLIEFHGETTGGIIPYTWLWDFGDGNTSSSQNPQYSYSAAGIYIVTLTVIDVADNQGNDTAIVTIVSLPENPHTVLLEYGTYTTCEPCVTTSGQLFGMYSKEHDHSFYYVSLVFDKNTKAQQRCTELGFTLAPDVFFDGGFTHIYGEQSTTYPYLNTIDTCKARTVANIDIHVTIDWTNNAELTINVTITNNDFVTYNGLLRTYIVEPISRWNNDAGTPYHFGTLDLINRGISVDNTKTISMKWDGNTKGYGDISPQNIMVIVAAFNHETGLVDETASGTPGEVLSVKITKPTNALYIRDNSLFPLESPLIFGNIDIKAEAYSASSTINRVVFYIDNVLMYTDYQKPFNWTWTNHSFFKIKHTLAVIAYDNNGNHARNQVIVRRFF